MRLLLDTSAVVHLDAGTLSPKHLAILTPDRTIPQYPIATVW
jgi:hypothetical protein